MGDQRRSYPRTRRYSDNLRLLCILIGTAVSLVVVYVGYREWTADDYPLPKGQCAVAYVKTGGNVTTAIREALRELDVSPGVINVHDVALQSNIREVKAGYPVNVCVTPAKDKVASVSGVDMGG